ncbi:hypothetical protein [Actinomadura macrotermitis]|uniref:Tetratricopeptide repeat protein n=1 Tax=Actinomadura macrotermitis TaxID=2585200 RepID=A0A7K0C224_9ACTN|nr:hypothetical protein [Actinomadura macrotermitis]MQY07406.1 hypothetical protein [Actinomadura macrotermitis]
MSVDELMQRAYALPYGEARTVLTEEAVRRAEETGDRELVFRARMELGTAYQYGGEPIKTFTTFSRCLADFDAAPGEVGEHAEHHLLWQFKWIVHSMTLFPEVPLDRTRAVLDDMERRYRLGGHSLQAVHARRTRVAQHLGDEAEADRWYGLWHATPRDRLSDCAGCDPSAKADYLAWRRRDDDALAVAEPILSEELSCTEQPADILTTLLPVYLRLGRLEEARVAHLRAYRQIRTQLSELGTIGEHVEFCARTGNEARGLEIVQRHVAWLDRAPSPHAAMRFAASAALLLGRVDGAHPLTRRPGEKTTAGALREELAARAAELAGRFDARNGTPRQGEIIREILDAEPYVAHLPLTGDRPAPQRRPEPVVPDLAPVQDLGAALELADAHWKAREMAAALAAWARYDELEAAGAEPTMHQRACRLDGQGIEWLSRGEPAAAAASWESAIALFEVMGDSERLHSVRGRLGMLLFQEGDDEKGTALMEEAVAYLDEHAADADRAQAARLRLASARLAQQRPADALGLLDGADGAAVLLLRGKALLELDKIAEAMDVLRECRAAAEDEETMAEASLLLGQLHARHPDGDRAEALPALDDAVAHASGPFRTIAHAERGSLLLALDRPADAAADLAEAVAGYTALGAAPQATHARVELAAAYYGTGRHLEAAEVAEQALPDLPALGDPDTERRGRLIVAHAQRELGEPQAADSFAALAEAEEHPAGKGSFLELAAEVLTRLDKDEEAAERFAEAAARFAEGGDPYGAVRALRRGAMCRWWSHQPDEAMNQIARARTALDDLPRDNGPALTWETALVDYDNARLLANAGDLAEALELVDRAIAGFTSLGEDGAVQEASGLRENLREALEG